VARRESISCRAGNQRRSDQQAHKIRIDQTTSRYAA
jgi:hypothetical protein